MKGPKKGVLRMQDKTSLAHQNCGQQQFFQTSGPSPVVGPTEIEHSEARALNIHQGECLT